MTLIYRVYNTVISFDHLDLRHADVHNQPIPDQHCRVWKLLLLLLLPRQATPDIKPRVQVVQDVEGAAGEVAGARDLRPVQSSQVQPSASRVID